MALPEQPQRPPAWWVKWEDYRLDGELIRAVGSPYVVPLWDLLEPEERVPAFAAMANLQTPEDCLAFARRYSLLGIFAAEYPLLFRPGPLSHGPWVLGRANGYFTIWDAFEAYLEDYPNGERPEAISIVGEYGEHGELSPVVVSGPRYSIDKSERGGSFSIEPTLLSLNESAKRKRWSLGGPSNPIVFTAEPTARWLIEANRFRHFLDFRPEDEEDAWKISMVMSEELLGLRLAVKAVQGRFVLEWRPSSLLTALWFQLVEHVTGTATIRRCNNCNRLFVPDEPRAKYCSYRCRIKRQNDKARGKLKTDRKEAKRDAKGSTRTR